MHKIKNIVLRYIPKILQRIVEIKIFKIIFQSKSNEYDKQIEDAIEKLQKSLTSKLIDDFYEAVDQLLSSVDIVQKKHDRKKERFLLSY